MYLKAKKSLDLCDQFISMAEHEIMLSGNSHFVFKYCVHSVFV